MSNTPAESVPAVPPPTHVTGPAAAETARQPKKFDNVQKSVASKAKALLDVFHSTGENIRGNINAALDGAGDAISGRKSGEVTGRKSGEQASNQSADPLAAPSTLAPTAATPSAPAILASEAPGSTAAQAAPEVSPSNEVVSATNTADPTNEDTAEKRTTVGELLNERFKRTVHLVIRVGRSLRSKGTHTAESFGATLEQQKQRASRRFSRAPKAVSTDQEVATDAASLAPATSPLPEVSTQQPAQITT